MVIEKKSELISTLSKERDQEKQLGLEHLIMHRQVNYICIIITTN